MLIKVLQHLVKKSKNESAINRADIIDRLLGYGEMDAEML